MVVAVFGLPTFSADAAPFTASAATSTTATLERVSVSSSAAQADGHSVRSAMSTDGRFVVFDSRATNLAPGTPGGFFNVYWRDRQTGTTERVGVGVGGAAPNSQSSDPLVSDDGRYIAFWSSATNLVPGDTNGLNDAFRFDRQTQTTERVNVAPDGSQVSGGGDVRGMSADGRYVLFGSDAPNLVPGDTNGTVDLFVRDMQTQTTERVSIASDDTQGNAETGSADLSPDGRYVAFFSTASNLVPGDTNGGGDIFVRDRVAETTERVSVTSGEQQASATFSAYRVGVSADGRYVTFGSNSSNLVPNDTSLGDDVFLRDRVAGTTEKVSVATGGQQSNGSSNYPFISDDGRKVLFQSSGSNLVSGDTNGTEDIFVRDLAAGTTVRVNVTGDGTQANAASSNGSISGDGNRLLFASTAANLVPGDTNGVFDVFTSTVPAGSPGDTTAPTLTLPDPITAVATGPDGSAVSYTARATDNDDPAPTVDCTPASGSVFPLGETTVHCVATDSAGNTARGTFTVTVSDKTAPQVSVTAPAEGATVSGEVNLTASATDDVAVSGVQFRIDGTDVGAEDTTAPYGVAWDSRTVSAGPHAITAVARDEAGNVRTSAAVSVTVDQGVSSEDALVWHATNGNGLFVSAPGGTPRHLPIGDSHNPSWSPDRSKVVFTSNRDGNPDIWILDVESGALTNLTSTGTGSNVDPAWSPDGELIAFASDRDGDYEIYTVRIDGTGLRQVTTNASRYDWSPAWSPDGARLVYTDADLHRIVTVKRTGADPVTVISEGGSLIGAPAWSPDGARIAFHDGQGFGSMGIYTVRPDGSDRNLLSSSLSHTDTDPTWSPDGQAIGFTSQRSGAYAIWAMRLDGTGLTKVSQSVGGIAPDWGQNAIAPPPAPEIVWAQSGLWVGAPGATPRRVLAGTSSLLPHEPSWSPDRTRVVFVANANLYVLTVATGAVVQLTNDPGTAKNNFPAWSPDGRLISFTSSRVTNRKDIWVIRPDGTGLRNVTDTASNSEQNAAWSPDGTKLVYEYFPGLRVINVNGTGRRTLAGPSNRILREPSWSPDGRQIAVIATSSIGLTDGTLYVMSADNGSGLTALVSSTRQRYAMHPTWSPDGTQLAYTSAAISGAGTRVVAFPVADPSLRTTVSDPSAVGVEPDWGQSEVTPDTAEPTLLLPSGTVIHEATSPSGTLVTFPVSATDHRDPAPAISCAPPSGSTFQIGDTTVTCTATDVFGNQSTGSFTVSVRDTTAPTVTLTSPGAGARVGRKTTMAATATDAVGVTEVRFQVDGVTVCTDTAVPFSCAWDSSGSGLGSHTLRVIAVDAAGNQTTTATTTVTVVDPGLEIVWAQSGLWVGSPNVDSPHQVLAATSRLQPREPSWSPDRSRIVFVSSGNLFVLTVATGAVTQLTNDPGTANNNFPAWSPDGRLISFTSRRVTSRKDIWVIRPDGTGLRNVTDTASNSEQNAAWSPDGTKLVYEYFPGLRVINVDGTSARTVTGPSNLVLVEPSWSPDARRIAAIGKSSATSTDGTLYTLSAANGSGLTALVSSTRQTAAMHPTWSPDGTQIAYTRSSRTSSAASVVAFPVADPAAQTTVSDSNAHSLEPDWGQTKRTTVPQVTVCPDYDIPGLCNITVTVPNPNPGPMPGGHVDIVTDGGGTSGRVTLAPNPVSNGVTCVRLAGLIRCTFDDGVIPPGGITFDLSVIATRPGTWTTFITYDCGCTDTAPVRTADIVRTTGDHCFAAGEVLFESDALLPLLDVFTAVPGGPARELSAASGNEEAGAVWAPDHSAFAMNVGQPGSRKLYIVDLDENGCVVGQRAVPNQPDADNYQADWSRDGTELAFVSDVTGNHDIWTIGVNGRGRTQLTTSAGDDRAPSFSANGSLVAFSSNRTVAGGNDWNIWTVRTDGTRTERQLSTQAAGYDPNGADYSPSFSRTPGTSTIVWHSNSGPSWDLWFMNADGSNKRRVPNSTEMVEKNADWAMNDTKIVYDAAVPGEPADIWMMDADGSNRHRIAGTDGKDQAPSL